MTTVVNGLLGGGVAGLFAVLATTLAPTGVGILPGASRAVRVVAGTSYGVLAGGTLVAVELFVLQLLSVPPPTGTAMAVALLWAGVLFFLGAIVEIGLGREGGGFTGLLVYHGVFGVALGAWIRLTWIT